MPPPRRLSPYDVADRGRRLRPAGGDDVPSVASRVIEIGICAYEQDPCATLLVGLVYYGPIASAVRNDVRSAGAARAGLPLRIPRPALALPEAEHFSLTLSCLTRGSTLSTARVRLLQPLPVSNSQHPYP